MAAPSVAQGEIWAVPAGKFGWCAAVVARTPEKSDKAKFALIYVRLAPTIEPPLVDDVPRLAEWSDAWVGLTVLRPFNTSRWTQIGSMKDFDPKDWPVPPNGRQNRPRKGTTSTGDALPAGPGASIEVTLDRPTMTLIANLAATDEEVAGLPVGQVITAPSRFEDGLERYFDERSSNPMHDMSVASIAVTPALITRWNETNEAVRSDPARIEPDALPPGQKTDRGLRRGAWMAMPLAGGGFGAALVALRPPKHIRVFADAVVMGFGRRWPQWPTPEDVVALTPDDVVLCRQTSMICVRDGRWRVLGHDDSIDNDRWPVPIRWGIRHREPVPGRVQLFFRGASHEVDLDPALLAIEPDAGNFLNAMSAYSTIEYTVAAYLDDASTEYLDTFRVTPQRIRNWRAINRAIAEALGISPANFYDYE